MLIGPQYQFLEINANPGCKVTEELFYGLENCHGVLEVVVDYVFFTCLVPVFAICDGYSFSGRDASGISRNEEGVHFWRDGDI